MYPADIGGIPMKKLVDVLTVILLIAAFILAYYTGFVDIGDGFLEEPALATGTLAIISVIGAIVLLGVGCASTAAVRAKSGTMTKSFLALFIVQTASVVGMAAIMLFLLLGMFPLSSPVIRTLYIVFAMIGILGYVDAMLYTNAVLAGAEDEEDAEEDGVEWVEESDGSAIEAE